MGGDEVECIWRHRMVYYGRLCLEYMEVEQLSEGRLRCGSLDTKGCLEEREGMIYGGEVREDVH